MFLSKCLAHHISVLPYFLRLSLLMLGGTSLLLGQQDEPENSLKFEGDFRFRIEQDWNVRRPDGSFQDDRSRLRYRARAGVVYKHKGWSEFGLRLRTGDPIKQQDPQITLGDEFSGIPVSFEKAYAAFYSDKFLGWVGKNTFPFERQNELFWSDNVFPEGIALIGSFRFDEGWVDLLRLSTGHFIFATDGKTFGDDSYVQGIQVLVEGGESWLTLFPSFYYFNAMPNIPDGNETYRLDYAILHFGLRMRILQNNSWYLEADLYENIEDLNQNDSIPSGFANQTSGYTLSSRYGDLKAKGNWFFRVSYNYQERYSAVDFLAQNDWARWDYSDVGSPDGRLTNYKGWEFMVAYALTPKMDLQTRLFLVDQIVPFGDFTETNSRIRFDINIKL